jgi:hemerythrin-like metal-binding protein
MCRVIHFVATPLKFVFDFALILQEVLMELAWTKQMSVGNEILDSEHKNILYLVVEVERAIRARDGEHLFLVFKQFKDAIRIHFGNEAQIAKSINYHFDHHNLEHQYILKEIQLIEVELVATQGKWSESAAEHYFQFLGRWATDHIIEDDMKMKAILETYPYDFNPANLAG